MKWQTLFELLVNLIMFILFIIFIKYFPIIYHWMMLQIYELKYLSGQSHKNAKMTKKQKRGDVKK